MKDTLKQMANQVFINYLENNLNKTETSKIIRTRYTKNKKELMSYLLKMDSLFNEIPKIPTTLPLYASLTGNPHFLDFNTSSGSLFLHFLGELKGMKASTTEEKWNLLETINVYNDTMSNYTITYNLKGEKELENFEKKFGPLILNMENISNLNTITGINNQIFIFENPSMLNFFKNHNISIIITSGNPNLSFYRLLKKIDLKTQIFYNGDFDPEGLLIANKLKNVFPKLKLFCYTKIDYDSANPVESITNSRLKKLENINTLELNSIKILLQDKKMAGYQEKNIKNIEEFINKYSFK